MTQDFAELAAARHYARKKLAAIRESRPPYCGNSHDYVDEQRSLFTELDKIEERLDWLGRQAWERWTDTSGIRRKEKIGGNS